MTDSMSLAAGRTDEPAEIDDEEVRLAIEDCDLYEFKAFDIARGLLIRLYHQTHKQGEEIETWKSNWRLRGLEADSYAQKLELAKRQRDEAISILRKLRGCAMPDPYDERDIDAEWVRQRVLEYTAESRIRALSNEGES